MKPSLQNIPKDGSFITRAKWSGRVLEVADTKFYSVLTSDLEQNAPEQEGTIPISTVSEADRGLLTPGAFFSLTVGYRLETSGWAYFLGIEFLRLPPWTAEEVEQARRRVSTFN